MIDTDNNPSRFRPRSPRESIEPMLAPLIPKASYIDPWNHSFFSFLNGLLSFIMIVIVALGGFFYFVNVQLDKPGPLPVARAVIVSKGMSLNSIATRIQREGIISDSALFIAGAMLRQLTTRLQAGEFWVPEHVTMNDVLNTLAYGDAILYKITIPEGQTSLQIITFLKENEILEGALNVIPPEGVLLPDTYKFMRGTSRQDILDRMREAHTRVLDRIWERRSHDLPLKSKDELVILASIVEKETGRADERPRVASVFINRLKRSMRLQSDPTIIYGLVGGKGSLGRSILKSDIEKHTAYNTYKIKGLPPTPIANPGLAALDAAANPSRTNDFYFVSDGNGGHFFASTLKEHNRNVYFWRNHRDKIRRSKKEAESKETTPSTP
ncbi:MAG: endolytic transglycosylase MltG [Alphaproteobacteria bacterium]|nr:endolytic transglycosylase MltG [Alphaproteobacteria bacterium]